MFIDNLATGQGHKYYSCEKKDVCLITSFRCDGKRLTEEVGPPLTNTSMFEHFL